MWVRIRIICWDFFKNEYILAMFLQPNRIRFHVPQNTIEVILVYPKKVAVILSADDRRCAVKTKLRIPYNSSSSIQVRWGKTIIRM